MPCDLMRDLVAFQTYFSRALDSDKKRHIWYARAQRCLQRANARLDEPDVGNEIDRMLNIINVALTSDTAMQTAQRVLDLSVGVMVEFESKSRNLTGLTKQDCEEMLGQAASAINSELRDSVVASVPRSVDELRSALRRASSSIMDSNRHVSLPRRSKAMMKAQLRDELRGLCCGICLALANAAMAETRPNISADLCTTSIVAGALVFASRPGLPSVLPSGIRFN